MPFLTKGKTNWKYILIILVLALIVGGGVFGYLRHFKKEIIYFSEFPEIKKPEKFPTGIIEGSLGYPSDFIPEEMKVCTEDVHLKKQYCTEKHIQGEKYTHGIGYRIEVPTGDYYVFATLPSWGDYRAYYSEFVTCGLKVDCPSHKPIIVKVKANEIISNIDPMDWYGTSEEEFREIITKETANWKTYRNEKYKYEIKYPSDWKLYEPYPSSWMVSFTNLSKNEEFTIYVLETSVIEKKPPPICLGGHCSEATFFKDTEITVDKINGIQRQIIYGNFPSPLIQMDTYISKEKFLFNFSFRHWEIDEITSEDKNFYDQMLSTFRFLE